MVQICDAIDTVQALSDIGSAGENPTYRLSRFAMSVKCEEGFLWYHTLRGELLLLTDEESLCLQGATRKEIYHDVAGNEAIRQVLVEKQFLVSESIDELKQADEIRDVARLFAGGNEGLRKFEIFTTTDCNARCNYCYELGRNRYSMSERTALDVADYILSKCGGQEVKLLWFGGEPLFNWKMIEMITSRLDRKKIRFSSKMVSNGFLFDLGLIDVAKDKWHLEDIQITLDGTEDNYNRIKAYIHCEENAFQRVLKNIELLQDAGIKINIRLNMDAQNVDDLISLVKVIDERLPDKENIRIYMALIQRVGVANAGFPSEQAAFDACIRLSQEIDRHGFRKEKPLSRGLKTNNCMADSEDGITILPDGRLGKCEHFSETETVGSIYEVKMDKARIESWKERLDRIPECSECLHYPLCTELKKCSWNSEGCTNLKRLLKTEELKRRILRTYQIYKKREENK